MTGTKIERVPGTPSQHWHALQTGAAVAAVLSDAESGLSSVEAARRLAAYGANMLPEPPHRSLVAVVLSQFTSPLIWLLFVAAGIAAALGNLSDAVVILVVVALNATVGAIQEGRAQNALSALRAQATRVAHVVRDGATRQVDAREIVPGDVIVLQAGDAVPADARLLSGAALQLSEAALTGESVPVAKGHLPLAPDTALADRRNMVYAGTHVAAGRAKAVAIATGLSTELGRIATLAESTEEAATPLERRIAQFSRYIVVAAAVLFVTVVAVGVFRRLPLADIVMVAISQIVGIIPEGLPVAVTIALAVGVQRMARRKAIIRRLVAVETLGSTTVICSDKTGTLTRNEMTVTELILPDGRRFRVTGAGYDPAGAILDASAAAAREGAASEGAASAAASDESGALAGLLEAAVLCNDAHLSGPGEAHPQWTPVGDPTEVALLTLAIKGGLMPADVRATAPRRAEIPFDPALRLMATQHDGAAGPRVMLKGAPEAILELCGFAPGTSALTPLDATARAAVLERAHGMAARALRVMAFAVVDGGEVSGRGGFKAFRGKASLLGLVGQMDPPRPEVRDAVRRCHDAGIRVVMVTGDHAAAGLAIAQALGIARPHDLAIDGVELETLTDAALDARIEHVSVFARVHPAQKLRIVEALQRRNNVVAMTGDGVNDAPALVRANAGVAMGLSGTEVAKEASEMVLADDNFATIVAAVEEGRVVYRNIKKAILLLFSTSAAEVVVLLGAMLLGYPLPFMAVQILWNNLVTEGLITVNLVMEPAEGDEMSQPPTAYDDALVTRAMLTRMAVITPAIVVVTLGWFISRIAAGVPVPEVRTETFTLLAICEWYNVLNCRSAMRTAFTRGLFANPWLIGGLVAGNLLQFAVVFWAPLGRVFHTVPFGFPVFVALGVVGSVVLWVEELRKWVARRSPGALR